MENPIYICSGETFDTFALFAFIQDTAKEAPLSEIVACVERSLMAYVVNNWKHVTQFWFVKYAIVLGRKILASERFDVYDIGRMYGLED